MSADSNSLIESIRSNTRYQTILVCVVLALATLALYWQVTGFQFIHFDDDLYVFDNPHVSTGVSLDNILWSFRVANTEGKTYWHPLTWFSHMIDSQLFGMNAGMHHLMNVLFHVLNCMLLFLVLHRMTGAVWRSAFVAALFAFHPINVDSVAWVAERKNLISTSFWLLTMYAYVSFTRERTVLKYTTVMLIFILGLLSKPMLVTLPFALLLLDFWPLRRIEVFMEPSGKNAHGGDRDSLFQRAGMLVLEKIPLLAVSLVSIYISSQSMRQAEVTISFERTPLNLRFANAMVSYVVYLWKMVWPKDLTFFYPYPSAIPQWQVLGSLLLIVAISFAVLWRIRRSPYLAVGWLWYLGTLVPVLGIMQGGLWPAIAERWAYVPLIGILVALVWGLGDIVAHMKYRSAVAALLAAVLLVPLAARTWLQEGYWRDDMTLFTHGVELDPKNYVAHTNLGILFREEGDLDRAVHHYLLARKANPGDALIRYNLGNVYLDKGAYTDAAAQYSEAIRIKPKMDQPYVGLGNALAAQGRIREAIGQYLKATNLNPDAAEAHFALGTIYSRSGDFDAAVLHLQQVARSSPGNIQVRTMLAHALGATNRLDEAIANYKMVLRIRPDNEQAITGVQAVIARKAMIEERIRTGEAALKNSPGNMKLLFDLTILNTSRGDYEKASEYLSAMLDRSPDNPDIYYNMACIRAKQGRKDEAVELLKKSVDHGFSRWSVLKTDNDLRNIRDTEYFQEITRGR